MDLNSVFKDGGRGAGGGLLKRKLLNALVIAELAIALTLLCGAGLLIRSYQRLLEVNPGFEPRTALTFQVLLNYRRLTTPVQVDLFVQEVDKQIAALPGVTHAGFTLSLPILNDMISRYSVEGEAPVHESDLPASDCYVVTPDYLAAMGITLLQGRGFTDHDTADVMPVALINQTLAKQHFGSGNPIGRRIKVSPPWLPATWRTIVGVVADVRQYGLDIKPMPQVYLAFRQTPSYSGSFVVRTAGASAGLPSAIRSLILKLDSEQPIADVHPMEDWIVFSTATRRFALQLITVFSIVALSLAAIGIYGVVSYSVSQRTGEIGIRIALGAQPGDVVGMVLRQGISVTIAGIGLGLCGALVLARLIASLLYGLSAEDPLTLVAATSITAFIALAACLVPAMRAARVDPMVALRTE
jgi:putative ABC transport system permease protein